MTIDKPWREYILEEHRRAELQRLEMGYEGCGCMWCQELYKTLDLSKFGSRVHQANGWVIICARDNRHRDNVSDVSQETADGQGLVTNNIPTESTRGRGCNSQNTGFRC